jgi:exodeoxyribonuclease VII small subunit
MSDSEISAMSFAEASAELDAIIDELDRGVADVDELAARFARAADIAEELTRRLDAAERRIAEIQPRLAKLQAPGSDPSEPA